MLSRSALPGLVLTLLSLALNSAAGQEKSVRPGINQPFENPDVQEYLGKFEVESREIYAHRKDLVAACRLKPGVTVADVGAGTGLFSRLFAPVVGPSGKVYAVDIAPKFIAHVEKTCREQGLKNVVGVVCKPDSVGLPERSIDLAFICDTYHHFEFPQRTLASIHQALRPGGQLVLIDFHRIPGKSSEWILGHVRAGQDVFVKEVEVAGFKKVEEQQLLKENYFVRFEKVEARKQPRKDAARTVMVPSSGRWDGSSSDGRGPFDVLKYGAKGDGQAKDTQAIQAAIDACQRSGGGTVTVPAGTFLSGSLHLKSNVCLHLDHGATLRASPDSGDFDPYETLGFKNAADRETSFFHHALIWAEDAERVAITGTGTIHGNRTKRGGPKPIALKRCRFVTVSGITLLDSPNYCISLLGTDYVTIDGITIRNGYSDGIDPDCCRHVRIANCHIESWDDAIVPKTSFSLGERRSTENLIVTNCVLASNCNAFKLGTESGGDFRNITVSNCVLFSRPNLRPPVSGISLLSVDGGVIDGVAISNITMTGVRCPLFLRLGNRGRDQEKATPGALKNVVLSNIVASGAQWPCAIAGIPAHPIEGVTLSNVRIGYAGGGTGEQAHVEVPEQLGKYPSADMFGALPASGLFCRHARDLRLSGVDLKWAAPDGRPAVVCEDVSRLEIDALAAHTAAGVDPVLSFHQVRGALIRGCMPKEGTAVFLRVTGAESKDICLLANNFSGVRQAVERARGASAQSVRETANQR
jgi:ubiquinone/menaquinone biosynthesis C-methylase UbiE